MEKIRDLYCKYKKLEEEAFRRLCYPGDDFRTFKTKDLIDLSEKPVPEPDKEFILNNLTKSIRLRKEIEAFFKIPCRRHGHFVGVLQWIVGNLEKTQAVDTADELDGELREVKVAREVGVADRETYATDKEFLDRTLDSNAFLQFLDELEAMCGMICDVWRRARGGTLYSASVGTVSLTSTLFHRKKLILFGLFALVSTCIYHEIRSSIGVAQVLSPHWFDKDGSLKDIAAHSFHQYLKGLNPEDDTIKRIFTMSIGVPKSVTPKPIIDAIGCGISGSGVFQYQVIQHILKSNLLGPSEDLPELTVKLIDYSVYVTKKTPNLTCTVSDEDIGKLIAQAGKCIDILTLGQLYTAAVGNLGVGFRFGLDTPLIPMLVHLYLLGRLRNGCECEEDLDILCHDAFFQPVLFWNGLPTTKDAVMEGLWKWVVIPHGEVERISKSRYREPIAKAISDNGGLLNKKMIKWLGMVPGRTILETLESKLEEECLTPDIFVMRESAIKTAKALTKKKELEDEAEVAAHLYGLMKSNDDSKLFLKCFMSNWKVSRRHSIAPGEIKNRERKTPT
ncbi:MAG: hypothetical protein M1840_007024 [Geoglossum simile]|nr:MAG: hypothetical protein M1840_007024 [Geoglossum simile]